MQDTFIMIHKVNLSTNEIEYEFIRIIPCENVIPELTTVLSVPITMSIVDSRHAAIRKIADIWPSYKIYYSEDVQKYLEEDNQ